MGGSQPFDFSANPDQNEIVDASNTFWYYTMGNVAFIGFANSYSWDIVEPYFKKACQWVNETDPALVVLQGHWNGDNLGCSSHMDTEDVFTKVQSLHGCDALGTRLKYVEGHEHCNRVTKVNTGFLLGSFGFSGCGQFGLPILDTCNGTAKLFYFEIGKDGRRTQHFDEILDCFKTSGYSQCLHFAEEWMNEPLPSTSLVATPPTSETNSS